MSFQYPKPFTPLPRSTFGRLPEQEGEGEAAKRRGGDFKFQKFKMFRQLFYLQRSDRRTLLFCILLGVFALVTVTVLSYCGTSRSDSTAKKQTVASDSATRAFGASGSGDASQWRYDEGAGSAMAERFAFDPNTADSTQLRRLGLKPWQVRSIYRYRAKGGVFSEPADFARVYGLTLKQYRELEPYIRIGRDYQPAARFVDSHRSAYGSSAGSAGPSAGSSTGHNGHAVARDTVKYPIKLRPSQHLAVNTADTTALKRVPGIGSYYARRIVAYREKLGGFSSVQQLREIEGMPDEAIPYLTVDPKAIRKLHINKLTLSQLRKHPYLNYYQARDIVDYRRLQGPITSLSQLALLKDFTSHDIERLAPYIEY